MESRKGIIIGIAAFLIVLLLIGGSIYYLTRILRKTSTTVTTSTPIVTSSPTATPKGNIISNLFKKKTPNPTPKPTSNTTLGSSAVSGNAPLYQGQGFKINYPDHWGILTCTTSQNFEFDPYNAAKQSASCDYAVKPITVLVDSGYSCSGNPVNIGGKQVIKSVKQAVLQETGHLVTEYNWCFNQGGRNIFISHRVSPNNGLATSKDDFSYQVEQLIANAS